MLPTARNWPSSPLGDFSGESARLRRISADYVDAIGEKKRALRKLGSVDSSADHDVGQAASVARASISTKILSHANFI